MMNGRPRRWWARSDAPLLRPLLPFGPQVIDIGLVESDLSSLDEARVVQPAESGSGSVTTDAAKEQRREIACAGNPKPR